MSKYLLTSLLSNADLSKNKHHLQINHMREGGSALAPSAAMCRLSSVKSLVQVRCQACQEILTW